MKESKRVKTISRKLIKLRRRLLARHLRLVRIFVSVAIILVVIVIGWLGIRAASQSALANIVRLTYTFAATPLSSYRSSDGRVNILLLGKANEDPVLTDTMMVVSVPVEPGNIIVVSIPRDIWNKELGKKINESYWVGSQAYGKGLLLANSTIEEIIGVPIHYSIALDFEALTEVIDTVGGIDVTVERSFTDTNYPIEGLENDECEGDPLYRCRYETLFFEAGITHMNGATALKFSRSRQSEDLLEGTDFARAKRQQLVLSALRDRLQNPEVVFSPVLLRKLVAIAETHIETDLSVENLAVLAKFVLQSRNTVRNYVLPEEFLVNPPLSPEHDFLYIFLPRSGNWEEVHAWFSSLLGS